MASKALLDLLFEERSLVHALDILNGEYNEMRTTDGDWCAKHQNVRDKLRVVRNDIKLYLEDLQEV